MGLHYQRLQNTVIRHALILHQFYVFAIFVGQSEVEPGCFGYFCIRTS